MPADGLPYIGKLPGAARGIYTATGFNGNGMTLGTVSAIDLISWILDGKVNSMISLDRQGSSQWPG